ncbi:MAG: hypothetical protein OEU80_12680 [Deltaproteobacteria bacterium]|nr:hypothetical protein [Deltaproteobacteria bacterium]
MGSGDLKEKHVTDIAGSGHGGLGKGAVILMRIIAVIYQNEIRFDGGGCLVAGLWRGK